MSLPWPPMGVGVLDGGWEGPGYSQVAYYTLVSSVIFSKAEEREKGEREMRARRRGPGLRPTDSGLLDLWAGAPSSPKPCADRGARVGTQAPYL